MITDGSETWIEGRWVLGVEVELHFAPRRAWLNWIEQHNPVVVHAFATGELLFAQDREVEELLSLAGEIWSEGPPPLSLDEIERHRYHLSDMARDVGYANADTVAARMAAAELVSAALRAWCAVHRRWLGKADVLLSTVRDHDVDLSGQVAAFYKTGDPMIAAAIADHVLADFGGRMREYTTPRRPA